MSTAHYQAAFACVALLFVVDFLVCTWARGARDAHRKRSMWRERGRS